MKNFAGMLSAALMHGTVQPTQYVINRTYESEREHHRPVKGRYHRSSKYMPHQGEREKARRRGEFRAARLAA